MSRTSILLVLLLPFLSFNIAFGQSTTSSAAIFTVNDAGDDADDDDSDGVCATAGGVCTLRAAIQQANVTSDTDMIVFALGGGTPTISTSGIVIAFPVTMDGATGGATRIELAGTPGSGNGLYIEGGGSTIKHLIVHSFGGSGIVLTVPRFPAAGPGTVIEDTWIGLDKMGAHKPNGAIDLHVESSDNTIGGPDPVARNVIAAADVSLSGANLFQNNFIGTDTTGTMPVSAGGGGGFTFFSASGNELIENVISGNAGNGVSVIVGSTDNTIADNFIGTDPTGSFPIPNAVDGIHVVGSSDNIIRGNVISSNGDDGIELREGGARTSITANYIGTDATGSADLGNGAMGIRLDAGPENTIGGIAIEDRNIISGNESHGIFVTGEVAEAPFPNVILGNFIGTNAVGTAAIGNGGYGAAFEMTPIHFLGGEDGISPPGCAGACNLISGNGMGGIGLLLGASGVFIRGNLVGATADGASPMPNIGPGINILGANTNVIEVNRIAFNGGPGVRLVESGSPLMSANENAIRMNQIFENDGLGIDINGDGVTPNNLFISTGPNKRQPYPVLTSAKYDSTTMMTVVKGILQSDPNKEYGIEFFANTKPDTTRHGEGEMPLGMLSVTTDGDSRASFTHSLPGEVMNVTTTATDEDGNTSEFSRIAGGIIVNDIRDLADANLDDGICDASVSEEGDQCTLRAAIQTANMNVDERDEIQFNIVEEPTIKPATALPAITDPVVIDGTSQNSNVTCFPDFLPVEIDGSLAGMVDGLTVTADGSGSTIKGLTINNFAGGGIMLLGEDNEVVCNFIGTNTTGTAAKANLNGIGIAGSSNVIGGSSTAQSNVISGNTNHGVLIASGSGNRIEGNYIGPDKSGSAPLSSGTPTGNGWDGIYVDGVATNNTIGGTVTAPGVPPGNTISNNGVAAPANDRTIGHGIHIEGSNNVIQGNLVGLANNLSGLQNDGHGIYFYRAASGNSVGGTPATANYIAYNGGDGIRVEPSGTEAPINNTFLNNAIFENAFLGIDLGDLSQDGVTNNDAGDGDAGANNLVNFPVITEMTRDASSGDVTLDVTVDAPLSGGSDGIIEFFANEGCDASNHGEGAVSLGTRTVSSGSGPAVFEHVLSGLPECRFITSTFTDAGGSTSEFSACIFNKPECLKISEVQFWHQPPESEEVETLRTTDGNPVEIRTLVTNLSSSPLSADLDIQENIGGHKILPEPEAHAFAGNDVTTLLTQWKTSGFAWEDEETPQSKRIVMVSLTDETAQGTELVDTMSTTVTVDPRPVVLVHGLWSNAATWDNFKTSFTDVRPDWVSAAVGDNRDLQGLRMDTGQLPDVFFLPWSLAVLNTTTTIAQNAGQLETYIEVLRKDEEAHHVDIVAHSMGGLISRYYIDELMPDSPEGDSRPVVENLVMLGTPNLGSPCADLYFKILSQPRKLLTDFAGKIPFVGVIAEELLNQAGEALEQTAATNLYQLTPGYVQNTFNKAIHGQNDVPFYIYAGTYLPITCTAIGPGDGVVPLPSAFAMGSAVPGPFFEDQQFTSTLLHTDLSKDLPLAFQYAVDKLNLTPVEFEENAGKREGQALPFAPAQAAEEPQIILAGIVPVPPGGPFSVDISVPTASAFGVTLMGIQQVSSALYDPSDAVVDSLTATSNTADLFRTHYKEAPEAGVWTVTFMHDLTADTLFIPMVAWAYDTALRLNLELGIPDAQGQVPMRARLLEDGMTLAATDVTARITPTSGTTTSIDFDLFDDGIHGDDAAGDGVFGETSPALLPTAYTVSVWATYEGQVRSAAQLVDLTDVVNGTGIDLALEMSVSDPAASDSIVFALSVLNNGPETASDVTLVDTLPEGLELTSVSPAQGSCSESDGVITCMLGVLPVGGSTSIDLVTMPATGGLFVNKATVSSTESDWNTANNTVTGQANVATGTADEAESAGLTVQFALKANYPNPFNPKTTIGYDVPSTSHVRLVVFNATGQRIATLVDVVQAPGRYETSFDATGLPSGLYVYRMEAGAFHEVRSMVLLK